MKCLITLLAAVCAMAQTGIVEGRKDSPVRILIYEDLQCPDCAAFRIMVDLRLLPKYGAKVAFEHRDFPLAKHSWARKAAVAARYFDTVTPDLGMQFRRETMAALKDIPPEKFNDHIAAFAKKQGLDGPKAVAALDDLRLNAIVEEDYQEGVARGVAKTPTVFVNGEPFIETISLEEISKSIDTAIKEAGL